MKIFIASILLLLSLYCHAQNDRVNDFNNTNWLQTFNTIALNKKWSLQAEYQCRRDKGLKCWQLRLLSPGANYKQTDNVIVHAGEAWVEVFQNYFFPANSI